MPKCLQQCDCFVAGKRIRSDLLATENEEAHSELYHTNEVSQLTTSVDFSIVAGRATALCGSLRACHAEFGACAHQLSCSVSNGLIRTWNLVLRSGSGSLASRFTQPRMSNSYSPAGHTSF